VQLKTLLARAAAICLPQQCVLCTASSGATPLCADCRADLPVHDAPQCPQCALPTPQGTQCGQCLASAPAFDRTVAGWRYAWPVDRLVPAFKYRSQLHLTVSLADALWARAANAARPSALLPMPLHPARQRERGFNQSRELAKRLAALSNIALLPGTTVARTRLTPPQASLPLDERHRAIRGVFRVDGDVRGQHIALIDDVMTTGASLHELAKALKAAGAARVDCWVAARAIRD